MIPETPQNINEAIKIGIPVIKVTNDLKIEVFAPGTRSTSYLNNV
jgi:hypothetical protein